LRQAHGFGEFDALVDVVGEFGEAEVAAGAMAAADL